MLAPILQRSRAFAHGRPALSVRDGQAAAALADCLLSGISQNRLRRLIALIRGMTMITRAIPASWHRILPRDAPLLRLEAWTKVIKQADNWPDGDFGDNLNNLLELLDLGTDGAAEAGEHLLSGRAREIWRRALLEGPAGALDVSLVRIRVEDKADPSTSVVVCSASDLATCSRPYCWLLGLTSRGWPRTQREDPLLPAHIIDPKDIVRTAAQ